MIKFASWVIGLIVFSSIFWIIQFALVGMTIGTITTLTHGIFWGGFTVYALLTLLDLIRS